MGVFEDIIDDVDPIFMNGNKHRFNNIYEFFGAMLERRNMTRNANIGGYLYIVNLWQLVIEFYNQGLASDVIKLAAAVQDSCKWSWLWSSLTLSNCVSL